MNAPLPRSSIASFTPWFDAAPHRLHIAETGTIAQLAAARLVLELGTLLKRQTHVVLTPSVGRTMEPIFEVLRREHRNSIDWSRIVCVQMDEYAELSCSDPRSFAHALRRDFITPLGIGRFLHFYDAHGACRESPQQYEQSLRELGGIDCALHGVGRNGHIGFNEPRQRLRLAGGVMRLSQATRVANQVGFQHGISLGLGILREARSSIVVMLGEQKRDACYQFLFGSGGAQVPVSELRRCSQVSIYIDHAAVPGSLSDREYPVDQRASTTSAKIPRAAVVSS